ncbi:MAG: hypothetical protein ACTSYO_09095 [Candidatus Ranarchaeia archaeon]
MPVGMVIVRWDNRIGTVLEAKQPKNYKISPDLTMRIYGAHVLGEERGPGFITMKVRDLGIASYFSGAKLNYFVALILGKDERPDDYEEGLTEAAARIFSSITGKKYKDFLEDLYARVSRSPYLNDEQKLALVFANHPRYTILKHLIMNGSATKTELENLLRDELKMKAVDINPLLAPLIKLGLVATEWVEGLPSECAFLIRDAFVARVPPRQVVTQIRQSTANIPGDAAEDYMSRLLDYFQNYDANDGDASVIANVLSEPDLYDTINILRAGPSTREEIMERTKMDKEMVARAVEKLEHTDFIMRFRDAEQHEVLLLKTDPKIVTFYPEHCIATEIRRYNDREVPPRQALHHLDLLRQNYPKGSE